MEYFHHENSPLHSPQHLRTLHLQDKSSFERLFREHYPSLVHYAWRMLSDQELAEDIVQQFFVQLWEKRAEPEITGAPKSYLLRGVHNACLNQIKHQKVVRTHEQDVLFTSVEAFSETHLETFEMQQHIAEAIKNLPKECRGIFLMSRLQEKKYKEIADELGISIKTVENQMGKALRLIKESVNSYSGNHLKIMHIIFWVAVGEKLIRVVIE